MSTHKLFSPSKSGMWIPCPGSMAFPENQETEGGSSTFADNGTASHHWSGLALQTGADAVDYLGQTLTLNGAIYEMDEERASFCQMYIDDVRRRAIGGSLFVEYYVDLSHLLGEDQGGTTDAGIMLPATKHLIGEDLKYGTGEKVFASYPAPTEDNPEAREINSQLGLYLLGLLADMRLIGHDVQKVTGVICQPRLGHIDEHTISVAELEAFGRKAAGAVTLAGNAMIVDVNSLTMAGYLSPGEKQCRWCRAKANCPSLARYVADQVRADFETIQSEPPPVAPRDRKQLSLAYQAVNLIEDWCRAVKAGVWSLVQSGEKVVGPDGLPYKFVEGKEGNRAWTSVEEAENLLLQQLGPEKAYAPSKIITAPQAAKLLDKKATKEMWKDIFEPMIKKAPGKAVLAIGSDTRKPFAGQASADDFNDEDLNQ